MHITIPKIPQGGAMTLHPPTFRPLIRCNQMKIIKGTVARDFWPLLFYINRTHMDPDLYSASNAKTLNGSLCL
jgi:hypothetical protein